MPGFGSERQRKAAFAAMRGSGAQTKIPGMSARKGPPAVRGAAPRPGLIKGLQAKARALGQRNPLLTEIGVGVAATLAAAPLLKFAARGYSAAAPLYGALGKSKVLSRTTKFGLSAAKFGAVGAVSLGTEALIRRAVFGTKSERQDTEASGGMQWIGGMLGEEVVKKSAKYGGRYGGRAASAVARRVAVRRFAGRAVKFAI